MATAAPDDKDSLRRLLSRRLWARAPRACPSLAWPLAHSPWKLAGWQAAVCAEVVGCVVFVVRHPDKGRIGTDRPRTRRESLAGRRPMAEWKIAAVQMDCRLADTGHNLRAVRAR